MEVKKIDYYILSTIYTDLGIRRKVNDMLHRAAETKTLQNSSDIDLELLTRHCSQANNMYLKKFYFLFLLFCVSGVLYFSLSIQNFYFVLYLILPISYLYVCYEDFRFRSFIRNYIKDRGTEEIPLKTIDLELVESVKKHKTTFIGYYKDKNPFRNFGSYLGGWSLPVDVTRSNNYGTSEASRTFSEQELYDAVTKQLEKLNFEDISSEDCLLVNAKDIAKDPMFYNNETLLCEPNKELIKEFISSKSAKVRFYKVIKIKDWGNELVFTSLFRIYNSGENLFLETKFFILPFLNKRIKQFEDLKLKSKPNEAVSILTGNLVFAPVLLIASPLIIIETFFQPHRILQTVSRLFSTADDREQEIGTPLNIESIFRTDDSLEYYQSDDADFYLKTVEKRILNTIVDFLAQHNIDTSDFKENKTHILNHGIIMSGGEMKAGNLAVGSKNKIK